MKKVKEFINEEHKEIHRQIKLCIRYELTFLPLILIALLGLGYAKFDNLFKVVLIIFIYIMIIIRDKNSIEMYELEQKYNVFEKKLEIIHKENLNPSFEEIVNNFK